MYNFIISAFADEIDDDLNVQMDELDRHLIKHIEFRSADGKGILDYTLKEAKTAYKRLSDRGFALSAVGSPIGKIDIDDEFEPHLDSLKHIIEIAQEMRSKYIRMFSFFIPQDKDAGLYRNKVMDRLNAFVEAAKGQDVKLLHENEKHIYGDIPERCLDILETVNSPILRATYDFSNFVQCDAVNYPDAWEMLKKHVEYIHIKDSIYSDEAAQRDMGRQVTGKVHRPAGLGDGQCSEIIGELKKMGFDGFLSIEPHLGEEYGDTGIKRFTVAANALKKLLEA